MCHQAWLLAACPLGATIPHGSLEVSDNLEHHDTYAWDKNNAKNIELFQSPPAMDLQKHYSETVVSDTL